MCTWSLNLIYKNHQTVIYSLNHVHSPTSSLLYSHSLPHASLSRAVLEGPFRAQSDQYLVIPSASLATAQCIEVCAP